MLEELKKLNRYWASFLSLSGYEVDLATPKKTSKPKTTSSPAVIEGVNEEEAEPILEPMDQ